MTERSQRLLVTGGAGFIGSAVCRTILATTSHLVLNVDKLTYAANLQSLAPVAESPRYQFLRADITDAHTMQQAFARFQPTAVMHLAAESHVDRSIDGPEAFLHTNVLGTYTLLQAARQYWQELSAPAQSRFRFLHVSTDEVYGALGPEDPPFTETTAFSPNSPYSASKAASDHFARAWFHTYGLPVITTHCTNNYGPYHFPEKLIPLMILKGLHDEPMPVYGDGQQVRDWLFVEDHARALLQVVLHGQPGETYNIGGHAEMSNLALVHQLCALLDEHFPHKAPHTRLITHVTDRPGHDRRYAINTSKIEQTLGWHPQETFATGLRKTVAWYLENQTWWQPLWDAYQGQRLGVAALATPTPVQGLML